LLPLDSTRCLFIEYFLNNRMALKVPYVT
jgi:hypothetical protein